MLDGKLECCASGQVTLSGKCCEEGQKLDRNNICCAIGQVQRQYKPLNLLQ